MGTSSSMAAHALSREETDKEMKVEASNWFNSTRREAARS